VIDVRRLNVLRAVVETGSVAAAAELLSYTPSAVSQQCEHTSRVLAAVQDAEDALAAWRSGRTGRLRLAAFPTASSALVPGALADFSVAAPGRGPRLRRG
jgi:DNA-binding transcriptional LysR family regulator